MASDPGGGDQNYFAILGEQPPAKRRNLNLNNPRDFPQLKKPISISNSKSVACPKFLVIKNKSNIPIKTFNIFLIHKALESITSEQPLSISFTREGDLLILTKNNQQTTKFLKASKLSNLCDISVSLHPTLNTVKGVIYSSFLINLSEAEIVDGLREQGATECKKITKIRDGKVVDTPLHIISFNSYELPKEVNVAWVKVKVEPYIPSPMQCKNCFIIGHTAKHCKSDPKCNVCATGTHEPIPCKKLECINCKKPHRSDNKNCPTFQKRKEIIAYKTLNKCSFREATEEINKKQLEFSSPLENLEEATQKKKYKPTEQKTQQTTTNTFNSGTSEISSHSPKTGFSQSIHSTETNPATQYENLSSHHSALENSTFISNSTITNHSNDHTLPDNISSLSNIPTNLLSQILTQSISQYRTNDISLTTQLTSLDSTSSKHLSSENHHSMET